MNELQKNTHPLIRDGASQKQRQLEALSPDYAKVDDRSSSELLDLVYRFSRQVAFHSEGRATDNWTAFFRNSVPVQASLISKYDVEAIAAEYREMNQLFNATHSTEHLNSLLDLTLKMAFRIHDWFLRLDGDQSGLWSLIRNLIDTDLKQELRTLIGYVKAAGSWGYVPMRSLFDFLKAREWGLNPLVLNQPDPAFLQIRGSARVRNTARKKKVDALYQIFFKGVSEIQKKGPEFFEKSLKAQEDHAPQLGLFFAFLRLYQQSQGHLNEMTKKHLDFFYKKALKLENAKEVPDQAHLVFQLLGLLDKYLLEKDTAFNAGQDENGEDILFKLLEEIVLSQAQVESLRTLFLGLQPRTPNLSGVTHECGEEENLKVAGVYMAPVASMQDGVETPFPDEFKGNWATLGGQYSKLETGVDATSGQPVLKPYPDARLGLMLASPVLFLQEGARNISVTLSCDFSHLSLSADDKAAIRTAVQSFFEIGQETVKLAKAEGLSDNIANALILNPLDFPHRFDDYTSLVDYLDSLSPSAEEKEVLLKYKKAYHPFKVSLSGEKGWIFPEDVVFELTAADEIKLDIYLGPTVEPVVFPVAEVLGEDFKADYPVLKLELNPEAATPDSCYLYQFFRYLPVEGVAIIADVKDVRNLVVQHENAILDINQPIPAFGASPASGNPFYIGSGEAIPKRLTNLALNLSWENLPQNFTEHYLYYNGLDPFVRNSGFKIDIEVLNDGEWDSVATGVQLFRIQYEGTDVKLGQAISYFKAELDFSALDAARKNNLMNLAPAGSPTTNRASLVNSIIGELNLGNNSQKDKFANLFACLCAKAISKTVFGLAGAPLQHTSEVINELEPYTLFSQNGFLKLVLGDQDFLHDEFPDKTVLQSQAKGMIPFRRLLKDAIYNYDGAIIRQGANNSWIASAAEAAKFSADLPKEPYTPTLKELSMDYTAMAGRSDIQFIHLHPYQDTYELKDIFSEPTLLPTFEEEGTLYIGLSNLKPGANLNLLFQMAGSTADPYLNKAEVQWHYLKGNRWEGNELKPDIHILKDETNGLIQSGIIQFALPKDMTDDNTILPAGLHWIRATVKSGSRAVAETVKVYAQAAKVEFSPTENNDLKRLSTKLPAGAITAAQPEIGALEGISQDFEGFGGRPKESDDQFYVRVSERLRHKGRAVTLFDYERLVLQAFPEIYRAKCITHTLGRRMLRQSPNPETDYHLAPGYVTVALIPDLRNVEQANRLRPRVSAGMLERVKAYLQQRMSPFIRLRVLNPIYEEVPVKMDVKFVKGKSEDYYTQKLKEDLQQFLMPWAYEGQEEISFGGRIFRSTLLSFVEKRPYVDFVQNFKMIDENGDEQDMIEARTTRSILVSGKHEVFVKPCCQSQSEAGGGPDGIGRRRISGGFTI
ncbi:MAG: baseplate J/gp47 family protein, partial [Phaeodactylibacter sp.]|nr:baseplate J/gp47 family protein [Phaeodactylibacter sp.]